MPSFGAGEWIIILLVVLLLFGSAKLPALARSLGRSARILKAETKGLHDDDDGDKAADQPGQPGQQAQGQQAQAQSADARAEAARLREEAARLEREAAQQQYGSGARPLTSGEPIQGVPVSDPDRLRKS
ncbi:hypothetical protein GCM10009678_76740 [Actinomadura kijaniata]|uniref:Sec-independent protein translocase protein TatA n=1 Tax=Actinomadura namibiensis TaxID=182080 RepID=A0A7W3LW65_ACTNM|nr:Sec-independent protein translocase subunit TatA [Actinomadura namibiensis]MBA8955414.1 sec-independent protein translocase protein TatA [Actinomadura namibiensis]